MAPGLGLGLGLAVGCGRGVLTGLGGRLAAVLAFGWVVGVGFVGAWALAAAGLLAVGAGLEARLGGVPRGLLDCIREDPRPHLQNCSLILHFSIHHATEKLRLFRIMQTNSPSALTNGDVFQSSSTDRV